MKKITLIVAVLINFITLAQPILNVSDINPFNITGNSFTATSTTLGVGTAGVNQTWDFSSLVLTALGNTTTNSVSSAPFASSFPTSNYFLSNGSANDSFRYYNLTSNILEVTGASSDTQVLVNFANPQTIFVFPFTFNTIVNDTYEVNGNGIAPVTINYNAYGTVVTAFGTFTDVMRLKKVNDGVISYSWFKVNPYVPIIDARVSNTSSTINYTLFQQTNLATTQNEIKQFAVYPNPTSGNISIKNIDFSNKSMFVKVYNMLGNQIINNYKLETESANIDLSNYATGLYFIEIADENNKVLYTEKIIKK